MEISHIGFGMQAIADIDPILPHEAGHALASLHYGATRCHLVADGEIIEVQSEFDHPPEGMAALAILFSGCVAERMWAGEVAPVTNCFDDPATLLNTPLGEHDRELVQMILQYSPPLDGAREAALWNELLEVETILQRCLFAVDYQKLRHDLQRGRALVTGGSHAPLH